MTELSTKRFEKMNESIEGILNNQMDTKKVCPFIRGAVIYIIQFQLKIKTKQNVCTEWIMQLQAWDSQIVIDLAFKEIVFFSPIHMA